MFETTIYIVWASSKGSKNIYAIFADKETAEHNARLWQKKADEVYSYKVNFRVKPEKMYVDQIPYMIH